ncbi:MAG TPA: ADOP family duplicated permease [Terracidiphilus sp.]|jgi:predicted permease
MKLWSRITSALRNLFRKPQLEEQLDEEVQTYADMLIDERIAAGMSASEARRTALAEIGGVEQVKQAVRDHRAGTDVELLWQNLRFGLRQLWRKPGFTWTVIITLALSIGANTAIFSVVNALMLEKLPYTHPERMGTIYSRVTGANASDERININGEQWEQLRDDVPAMTSAVFGSTSGVNLRAGSSVQYVQDGRVSARYLEVLGLRPMLGRNFSDDEDRPYGPKAAILSYRLWRNIFAQDRSIVGQPILLKGEPYTVVGVLARDARTPIDAAVYTTLQPSREAEGAGTVFEVITRLRDGATWQEANAEINRAWSFHNQSFLRSNPGAQITYHSVPLQRGETGSLRPQVMALMLSAGLLLLIACANLAGLTLVRTLSRTAEVATRLALGASRWQIQKQFWTENLLLALVGGALAVGVASLALRGLLRLLPEHFLPVMDIRLDGRVLAFTLMVSLLTSILFGMLPALVTRRVDLRSSMSSRSVAGVSSQSLRQALIAGEIALTVVLLAASGLLIRTLIHLETLPPGFNPNGVLIAKASLDDARFSDPAVFRKLMDLSTASMRQIPGVRNAAAGLSVPYEPTLSNWVTLRDGKETGRQDGTDEIYVTPGYFDALQMNVIRGRVFADSDGPNAQHVAVVNQAFARKFYNGANPVGRTIDKNTVIVGEVGDVSVHSGMYAGAPLMTEQAIYIPAAQAGAPLLTMVHMWFQPDWIVRTTGPIAGLTAQMQRALADAAPSLPISGFYGMDDLLARTLTTQRIEVALLSSMAGLALLLSTLGIFALVANMVTQRTREIGIRMALGSTVGQAMTQIGRSGAIPSATGLLLGLVLSTGILRSMRSVLYGIDVYDISTILMVVLTLVLVTAIATTLPTLRIAAIDPAKTLRDE